MHDKHVIHVRNVVCAVRVGVSEAERATPQQIRTSVSLTLFDPPEYPSHDLLSATVDYDAVIGFLREGLAQTPPTALIETLADRVARHCLALSARIASVEVEIAKPSVLKDNGEVAVSLMRFADKATHRHALFLAEESRREEARL